MTRETDALLEKIRLKTIARKQNWETPLEAQSPVLDDRIYLETFDGSKWVRTLYRPVKIQPEAIEPIEPKFEPPLNIRALEARDKAGVRALYAQPRCEAAMTIEFLDDTIFDAWWDAQLGMRGGINVVAEKGFTIVGHAVLERQLFRKRHVGHISLFVHDAYHRQGIGSMLLHMLVSEASPLGLSRLQLEVFEENKPAIALYKKVGFNIEGEHPAQVDNGNDLIDTITMGYWCDW